MKNIIVIPHKDVFYVLATWIIAHEDGCAMSKIEHVMLCLKRGFNMTRYGNLGENGEP